MYCSNSIVPNTIILRFLYFILNFDHPNDWNMLANPFWVMVMKKVNRWLDPTSMTRECDKGVCVRRIVSIEQTMIIVLNWTELSWTKWVYPILELLLDSNKISVNGRNIYEWNEINLFILNIDQSMRKSNEGRKRTLRRFEISISINIQYWKLLLKLIICLNHVPSRVRPKMAMESRFGRSRFNHFFQFHYYFASLVNMIHHHHFH